MGACAIPMTCSPLRLANISLQIDRGGVHFVGWPDADALAAEVAALARQDDPVVRWAGGALIADLCLLDNLVLEPTLRQTTRPADLLPGVEALFAGAGCPLRRSAWQRILPERASELELLQVRVGRALMADPDVLVMSADTWVETLLAQDRFSQSFCIQFPWRALVWASAQPHRSAAALRVRPAVPA